MNLSEGMENLVNKVNNQNQMSILNRRLSFEVDFELFQVKFWPKVRSQSKLSPITVWTEIYSQIKGSNDAYKSDWGYMTLSDYLYMYTSK